jgi:YHS domain-containing protein
MIKYCTQIRLFFAFLGLCGFGFLGFYSDAQASQPTISPDKPLTLSSNSVRPVMTHKLSGFALNGFDPVTYFSEGAAKGGNDDFEYTWQGNTWRFISKANLEAFKGNPEAFAPQFGGYDAEAVSRGIITASEPAYFTIQNNRLYLFRSNAARALFLMSNEADKNLQAHWSNIQDQLYEGS